MDRYSLLEVHNFAFFEKDNDGEWVIYKDFFEFRNKIVELFSQLVEIHDMESPTFEEQQYKLSKFEKITEEIGKFKDSILLEIEEEKSVESNQNEDEE